MIRGYLFLFKYTFLFANIVVKYIHLRDNNIIYDWVKSLFLIKNERKEVIKS